MEERKPEGAAVMRTERTDEVGSCFARLEASGPRERSRAGLSVGRAVMPAREALEMEQPVSDGVQRVVSGERGGRMLEKVTGMGEGVQLKKLADVRLPFGQLDDMAFLNECGERSGLWSCKSRRDEQAREEVVDEMHGDVWKCVLSPWEGLGTAGNLGKEVDDGVGMKIR